MRPRFAMDLRSRKRYTECMQTLVIEVSGGVVQEVYTDGKNLRVVLVDWDAGESPGDKFAGGRFRTLALSKLPRNNA
jgi:hypothetical protein